MKLTICLAILFVNLQADLPYTPTSGYEPMQIEGFHILFNKQLRQTEPDLSGTVLEELTSQLHQINRRVPPAALACLKQTTIWVEKDNSNGACHHPNRQWLIEHNYNPDKTGCIEIGNARHFVDWTKDQPYMVLHEMAHYYHWKVLGYNNPEIISQYRQAVESGSYDRILKVNGNTERAYALTNEKEYFAETTEAFFGTNDLYPFVRGELKVHDPNMYALLEKLWNHPPTQPGKTDNTK